MSTSKTKLLSKYRVNDENIRQYNHQCLIAALAIFAAYGLTLVVPQAAIVLPLVVLLALPRWMIHLHELLHIDDATQIHPFVNFIGISPIPLSLLSLSYQNIRTLHLAHHAAPASETDPDAYHIRGPLLRVILNAFTVPEQSTLHWMAHHGFSRRLLLELIIKGVLFGLLAWSGGMAFVYLWVSLRLVYGVGDLAFFRMVHHQQGNYGTFAIELPPSLMRVSEFIFGRTVTQATIHHNIHHQYPYIAVHGLNAVRAIQADVPRDQTASVRPEHLDDRS